ncbi:piggyBac transposable element-derived protein 1-like [Schistocerca gregaria]|uniref:piggyBac transposable element-derived protein 1-like n=1 Tax=Schistocerca gregaria TaxID=7010 RepID=UPI00211E5B64|nr:piggyBac transposable element-derived protein 1-like [Schistocerca gregaria]
MLQRILITLLRRKDSSQVTLVTNVLDESILGKSICLRWNRESRKKVSIPQPSRVQEYNHHMEGVDFFDNQRSLYRIRIRSKKWYWPMIRLCLNGAVVNMWILYRQLNNNASLLEFTRRIALSILTSPNTEKPRGLRPRFLSQVQEDISFDHAGHMIDVQST